MLFKIMVVQHQTIVMAVMLFLAVEFARAQSHHLTELGSTVPPTITRALLRSHYNWVTSLDRLSRNTLNYYCEKLYDLPLPCTMVARLHRSKIDQTQQLPNPTIRNFAQSMVFLLRRVRTLQSLVDHITSAVWHRLGIEQIRECANYEEWFTTQTTTGIMEIKKRCTLHMKLNTISNVLKNVERHHMEMLEKEGIDYNECEVTEDYKSYEESEISDKDYLPSALYILRDIAQDVKTDYLHWLQAPN